MTDFYCQAVKLGKIGKHPNADNLSITTVFGRPVIFRTGTFRPGDVAAYIPIDAVVDTARPEFAWLKDKANAEGLYRVKLQKIRNVPSYGFLEKGPEDGTQLTPGQNVMGLYGIKKYDPGPAYQQGAGIAGTAVCSPQEGIVPLYDIESLRRYSGLLDEGEPVWISEKIHGSNGRWVYVDGELYCGSRKKFRKDSVWNEVAKAWDLPSILSIPANHGLVLYGEVYGPGIQDLTYGLSKPSACFFDIYDTKTGRWYDPYDFLLWCNKYRLQTAPTLHWGPFNLEKAVAMAEGESVLCPGQVREGIVVKPQTERWNMDIGRVFLKLPGEGFLLRKQSEECAITMRNSGVADPSSLMNTVPKNSWWTRTMTNFTNFLKRKTT